MSWKLYLSILVGLCLLNKNIAADDVLDDVEETASVLKFSKPLRFFKLAAGDWSKQWGAFKILEGMKALRKGKELKWEAMFPVLSDWKFLGTENVYVISDPQTGEITLMTPEQLENSKMPILIPDFIQSEQFQIRENCEKPIPQTVFEQTFESPIRNINRNDIYENQFQETKMMPVSSVPRGDGMELIYTSQPDAISNAPFMPKYIIDNSESYVSQIETKSLISEPGQLGGINIFPERPQNEEQKWFFENSKIDELGQIKETDSVREFLKRSPDMFQNYGAIDLPKENPIPSGKTEMFQGYRAMENLPTQQKQPQSYQGVNDFVALDGYRAANAEAQNYQTLQGYRAKEDEPSSKKQPQSNQGVNDFVANQDFNHQYQNIQNVNDFVAAPLNMYQGFQGMDEIQSYQGYRAANEESQPEGDSTKTGDDKEIVGTFGAKHHKGKGGSSVHHHHYDNDNYGHGGYGGGGYGHGGYGHGGYGHGGYGHGGYGHGGYGHGGYGYGGYGHGGYGHGGYGHGGYGHGGYGHGHGHKHRNYRSPAEVALSEEESINYRQKSSLIDSAITTNTRFDEDFQTDDLISSASEQNRVITEPKPLFSLWNPFSLLTRALRQCPCEQAQQSNANQDYSQFNYQPYPTDNFLSFPPFHYPQMMMPFSRPVYAEPSQYSPIVGASPHVNYNHNFNINSTSNKTNIRDPSVVSFPVPTALRTPFLGFFGNSPTPEYSHQHHNTAYFDPYAHINYGHHHHHRRRDTSYPFFEINNRPARNIESNQIPSTYENNLFNNDNSKTFKLKNLFQLPKTNDNFNAFDLLQLPKLDNIWQSGLRFPKADSQNPQRKFGQNPFTRRQPTVHVVPPNYVQEQPMQEYNPKNSKIEKKNEREIKVSEVYPTLQSSPVTKEKTIFNPKPAELNREKLNQPRQHEIKSYAV